MYKFLLISAIVISVLAIVGYKSMSQAKVENKIVASDNSKILIAYYSTSGHTKAVAEAIQKDTGGDLFEIMTEATYPEDYHQKTEQAKKEIEEGYRPKLTTTVADLAQYDIVFIGSPNWWGTIPPSVSSFIEGSDLSGKKIIPFITHGGGGVQNTISAMTTQCKGCSVSQDGWVGYGSRTLGVSGWLKNLGLKN